MQARRLIQEEEAKRLARDLEDLGRTLNEDGGADVHITLAVVLYRNETHPPLHHPAPQRTA